MRTVPRSSLPPARPPIPIGGVRLPLSRNPVNTYIHAYAYGEGDGHTPLPMRVTDRYRQEGRGTAIRRSRDWRHRLHRLPSTLTSMPMPMPMPLWVPALWEPMGHEQICPPVGVFPFSGGIALMPVSDTMMRSWFRIRMDLAFQPTLWILCEFGWRRD